jgi:Holliday junction resolvase RusA-like endonuclease
VSAIAEPVIVVEVEGRPAPKGSRNSATTKSGKSYTYPASTFEKPWVGAVAEATRQIMRHAVAVEKPYRVELEFKLRKGKYAGRAHPWPTVHDLDKLSRAVIDGLVRGGAMEDDRHVTALTARKRWAEPEEDQGVRCEITSEQGIRSVM